MFALFPLIISIGIITPESLIITKDLERDAIHNISLKQKTQKPSFEDMLNGAILHRTLKRLKAPQFFEYSAANKKYKRAKSVDLKSHPTGKEYRTVITNGFKHGPIFAKNYRIASCGCGTGVRLVWVINAETGKIVDHIGVGDGMVGCSFYTLPDSKLFIDVSHLLYEETDCHAATVKFYVFNEKTEKLELIKEIEQEELAKIYPLSFKEFSFQDRLKYNVDPKKYSCSQDVTVDASKITTQEDPFIKLTNCKSRDSRHLL